MKKVFLVLSLIALTGSAYANNYRPDCPYRYDTATTNNASHVFHRGCTQNDNNRQFSGHHRVSNSNHHGKNHHWNW